MKDGREGRGEGEKRRSRKSRFWKGEGGGWMPECVRAREESFFEKGKNKKKREEDKAGGKGVLKCRFTLSPSLAHPPTTKFGSSMREQKNPFFKFIRNVPRLIFFFIFSHIFQFRKKPPIFFPGLPVLQQSKRVPSFRCLPGGGKKSKLRPKIRGGKRVQGV